ncbi:MAG: hypothetical protein QOI04_1454 [Verrucomicrobiota bacterium]|jgi:hypothetical protein
MTQTAGLMFIAKKIWDRTRALLPKDDWLVVGWVLATKILLFAFGARSFRILQDKALEAGPHPWFDIWNRWDSLHYQDLAKVGYSGLPTIKILFFPLFPWCVRLLAQINGDYFMSALVVSGIALLFAAILMRRLVQLDFPPEISLRSVWFFLIFPTAYFLHVGFTESLFLAFAFGSLLSARRDDWLSAGLLGALCCMTRPTGVILLPTLAVEAMHQGWLAKHWRWRWLWIAIVPTGFLVYLLINWHVAGDVFSFVHRKKEWFAASFAWPWIGIRNSFGSLQRTPNDAEIVGGQEIFFVALGLVCAILSWIKLRPSYAVWITGTWLLFTSTTFIESAPRYSLTLFPIFILFALAAENRFWNAIITFWSLLFFSLFASLFVRGWWAF